MNKSSPIDQVEISNIDENFSGNSTIKASTKNQTSFRYKIPNVDNYSENELFNHREKCRFCFEPLRSKTKQSIPITSQVRQKFLDLTGIKVKFNKA